MSATTAMRLESVTDIVRRRGCHPRTVERAIAQTGVRPANRFGVTRVFDAAGIDLIDRELDRVLASKAARRKSTASAV